VPMEDGTTGVIKAHRAILADRVEYFMLQFSGDWADNQNVRITGTNLVIRIKLTDYTFQVFKCLIHFIYTGRFEADHLSFENLIHLFNAAKLYQVETPKGVTLSQLCYQLIISKMDNLSIDGLIQIYDIIRPHDEICLYFVMILVPKLDMKHFITIAKFAHDMKIELLMKAVIRYGSSKRQRVIALIEKHTDMAFKLHLYERMLKID